jgi:glycosyltransferase involved in cell wall biosynthesis
MNPRVSVLMSVYNGEQYLKDAIESILSQTFCDFEFIVIDDGSSDSTPDILAHYQQREPRVLAHRFDHNRGLSAALNFGIRLARGEYIARMDADDISLPNRLQEQVGFMDAHPEIGVCGTWVELIGAIEGQIWKYPTRHEAIHARMLFANTLVHPSVIMRVVSIKENALQYDEDVRYAQDYELWGRAITSVQFANLDQILLQHRIHAEGTGVKHRQAQYKTHEMVYHRLLSPFSFEYSDDDLRLHQQIGTYQYGNDIEFLHRTRKWLEAISRANRQANHISPDILDKEIGAHWIQACQLSRVHPLSLCFEIITSPLRFGEKSGFFKLWREIRFCFGKILSVKTF